MFRDKYLFILFEYASNRTSPRLLTIRGHTLLILVSMEDRSVWVFGALVFDVFLNDLESFHNNNLNDNGRAFRWPETIYNPIHSRWHHWVKAKRTVSKNKTFFFVEPYSIPQMYFSAKNVQKQLVISVLNAKVGDFWSIWKIIIQWMYSNV